MSKIILKPFILQSLEQMSGLPMTFGAIKDTVSLRYPGMTEAVITLALKQLESDGFVTGLPNAILETTTWQITDKGRHQLSQL